MQITEVPLSEFERAKSVCRKTTYKELYAKMEEIDPGQVITFSLDDKRKTYSAYRSMVRHKKEHAGFAFDFCWLSTENKIYIKKTGPVAQ